MSIGHPHTPSAIVAAWGRWLPATVRVGEGVEDALQEAIPGLLGAGYGPMQVRHALASMTLLDPPSLISRRAAGPGLDRAAYRMQASRRYRDRYQDSLARLRAAHEAHADEHHRLRAQQPHRKA